MILNSSVPTTFLRSLSTLALVGLTILLAGTSFLVEPAQSLANRAFFSLNAKTSNNQTIIVGGSVRHASPENAPVVSNSVVPESTMPSLQARALSLPADLSIQDIQMLNPMAGWLWGHGSELYKTADGGEHWSRVQLKLPTRSYVTDAYFISPDTGWIAACRTELDFDNAKGTGVYDNATWIFETRDGGKTLIERLTIKDGQITKIRFVDESEGWATGRMLSRGYPERDSNLVLKSTTGGKDWKNLSALLPQDRGVEGLHVSGSRTMFVLTVDGLIYQTTDGGEHWTRVEKLEHKNDQVAIWRFNVAKDNRLLIVGGASAMEGTHGLLATKDEGKDWVIHEILNTHLTDAMFLSDSEILACGSMLLEPNSLKPEVREAVLLYSPDKGKTWTVLSRYPRSTFLTALTTTDANHVLAVGFQGLVLKLKLPLDQIPVARIPGR